MASRPSRSLAVAELNEAMQRASREDATKADLQTFRAAIRQLDREVVGRRLRRLHLKTGGELQAYAVDSTLLRIESAIQDWESGRPTPNLIRRLLAELRPLCKSTPATPPAAQPQEKR